MRFILFFQPLAAAVAIPVSASAAPIQKEAGSPPATAFTDQAEPIFSRAEIAADLELLRTAFDEGHPSAYRYRSKAAVDAAFATARSSLRDKVTMADSYVALARAVASLQDGHTQLSMPEQYEQQFESTAPLLPFRFHVTGNRLFVLRDLRSNEHSNDEFAGLEVESIDARPASQLLRTLISHLEGDGSIQSNRIAKLRTFRFNLLYGYLHGTESTYRLKFRDRPELSARGRPLTDLLGARTEKFLGDAAPPIPAELTFADKDKIAVLIIRSFASTADREGKQKLSDFIPAAFAELKKRGSKRLIIDVRRNGGGEDLLGRVLLQHLIDQPFDYYRGLFLNRRELSFGKHFDRWPGRVPDEVAGEDDQGRLRLLRHPNLGTHPPAANRFKGKVFIVMDGGSFSTTAEFLSIAHFHQLATFIGEEAGGGYYGDTGGAVPILTLPNSRMRVRFPLVRYEMAVSGFSPHDRGVPPTIRVEPSVADLIEGKDRAMELALEKARAE